MRIHDLLNDDGSPKGIYFSTDSGRRGKAILMCLRTPDKPELRTSVGVGSTDFRVAWAKVVDTVCEYYDVSNDLVIREGLMASRLDFARKYALSIHIVTIERVE
jgi:hypothetical protein